MTFGTRLGWSSIACCLLASFAQAQADAEPELTIRLIVDPAAELPEAVTRTITLPETAAEAGATHSERGLTTANENRANAGADRDSAPAHAASNRRDGAQTASDAQALGREFGEDVAAAAAENREDLGRGLELRRHVPDLPDRAPDGPPTPDQPGPPSPPGPPGP